MAGSLESVLAGLPGIGGYLAKKQFNEREDQQQIAQAGALQGILAQVRAGQQKQKAAQMEQMFRAELGQLGPNPSQEALAQVAAKYSPAKDILTSQTASADRKAGMQAAALNQQAGREERGALQSERLAAQAELARQRSEDMRLSQAERNQARMDSIRLAASLRPERQVQPLVPIVGPDGKPILVPREQAVGKTPAGAGSKAETVAAGKSDVDRDIVTLKSSLDALNDGGGITSTEKGVVPNVARWASTTGPGQLLGTMGGTKNQKERDVISQARPLLLRSIMQSTGMSAKQLDSNAELKLWLSTATDPTKGYEANVQALNNIAAKYGSGPISDSPQQSSGAITQRPSRRADDVPTGIDAKVWGAMTPAEKALFK